MAKKSNQTKELELFKDIKAFAAAVKKVMEKSHPSAFVGIREVPNGNNQMQTGIFILEQGYDIAPHICLEDAFEEYRNGKPLYKLCQMLEEFYQSVKPSRDFNEDSITNFSTAKEKICYKLINARRNAAKLKEVPHRLWNDLAVVYYIPMPLESVGVAPDIAPSLMVNNKWLELWGVTEDVLYEHAHRNTPALLNAEIVSEPETAINTAPVYIATNNRHAYGAAVMLYDGFLEKISRQINGDFYIFPNSIHKIAFAPVPLDIAEYRLPKIIRKVNAHSLAPEEILSDNVYRYHAEDNSIQLIS